jgi:putative hydrolase of the HAD superfamily
VHVREAGSGRARDAQGRSGDVLRQVRPAGCAAIVQSVTLPTVLLLDLDDTILDDTGARDRCWQETCDEAVRRRPELDAARLRDAIEVERARFWADPDEHRRWRIRLAEAHGEIVCRSLAAVGVDDRELGMELGELHHKLRRKSIVPLAGAIETLHELRSRGVTLGLITNGSSEGQREKIEKFALAAHFAYIGIEGEVGHGKPHRIAYNTALTALGVDASDCWMVGDNLEWDVAGAQAVGIRGIWLDKAGNGLPDGTGVVPDGIIRSIGELLGEVSE